MTSSNEWFIQREYSSFPSNFSSINPSSDDYFTIWFISFQVSLNLCSSCFRFVDYLYPKKPLLMIHVVTLLQQLQVHWGQLHFHTSPIGYWGVLFLVQFLKYQKFHEEFRPHCDHDLLLTSFLLLSFCNEWGHGGMKGVVFWGWLLMMRCESFSGKHHRGPELFFFFHHQHPHSTKSR